MQKPKPRRATERTLENFRHKPGTKLRLKRSGTPIMVIELAAGMIRENGRPSGGDETVAVVSFETGKASFLMGYEIVEPLGQTLKPIDIEHLDECEHSHAPVFLCECPRA